MRKSFEEHQRRKRNKYAREYQQRKRAALIKRMGGKCVGYKKKCDRTADLQIDHVKAVGHRASCIWLLSKTKLEEEIKLCQLLCVECHNRKTADETGGLFLMKSL